MDTVRCDDCGQENQVTALIAQRCESCGASLVEEKQRTPEAKGSVAVALVTALASTGAFVVAPPWALYAFGKPLGALVYLGVFALLLFLGEQYEARDDYRASSFLWDNPLSYRDERDRAHFSLGVALLPVNLVRFSWTEVWRALAGGDDERRG